MKASLIIKSAFRSFGLDIKRIVHEKNNPLNFWDDDAAFNRIYPLMKNNTLVGKKRCYAIYQLLSQVKDLSGDVAEVGVYRGGTAKLMAEIIGADAGKQLFIFDTFGGMPKTDEHLDWHKEGDFSNTTFAEVQDFLKAYGNVTITKGVFPETAGIIEDKRFSFVNIDVDIHESVLNCCKFFYPRLNSTGMMLFDDYGFITCPGAKKAVDEFFADKKEVPIYLATGQCLVIKK